MPLGGMPECHQGLTEVLFFNPRTCTWTKALAPLRDAIHFRIVYRWSLPPYPRTTTGYLLASLRDASYRRIFPVQPGGLEDGSRWSFPAFPGNDHRNAAWRNQRIPEGCQKMTKDLRTRYQSQRIHPGDGGLAPLRGAIHFRIVYRWSLPPYP
jgi:hypothetical protein